MNTRTLQEIVRGEYGRKVAYTAATEVTPQNVVKIIGNTIGIFYKNREVCKYLWNYKNGDQPILYRTKRVRDDIVNRIVENHAYELTQFKVAQSYGEPIQYVSRRKEDKVNEAVDILNDYMTNAFKQTRDVEMGEWQSVTGTSFKAIQRTGNNDVPFRIVVPTPLNTYIIYQQDTHEPLLAVQMLKDIDGKDYKLCFSKNKEFVLRDGKLDVFYWNDAEFEYKLHTFGGIPIVEYPNNSERLSDIEIVISMLDAVNSMTSNRMDGIEQFVQSFMKFINVEVDETEFAKMKQMGAFSFQSNNAQGQADVDILTQELNQTESQVAKKDLMDNILSISGVPNREGNTGGDTQGAVELRNGWDFSKQRTMLKDPLITESEKRFANIALNVIKLANNDCPITVRDFDVQINHSPTDNLCAKTTALVELLKAGIHPLVAIKVVGLWGDAEKVFLMSKPYLDSIYKTVDVDTEELQKKANLLISLLNAGVSPEEASKQVGFDFTVDGKKWNIGEEDV